MKKIELNNQVVNYIAEAIEFIDDPTDNNETFDWQIAKIYHTFKRQMLHKRHDLRRPVNERKIFIDWMQGLPSDFHIEFRTFEHIELLESWYPGIDWALDRDPSDIFYKTVANTFYDLLLIYDID